MRTECTLLWKSSRPRAYGFNWNSSWAEAHLFGKRQERFPINIAPK